MSHSTTPYINAIPRRAWIIWLIGMTFVLFQFTLQLSSGVLIKQLAQSFSLSAFQAGILSASYYYIYVILQVPAGMLADRFGARKILTLGSIVCSFGCLLFAMAPNLAIAEIGRLFMGTGGALSFVGVIFLVQHWFPAHRFALMVGMTETIGLLSTIAGDLYLADFVTDFGWRYAMKAAAVVSLLIAVAIWLIVRDTPLRKSIQPTIAPKQFFQEVKQLIQTPLAWWNGIYCGLLFSLITVFVALWGIPFMIVKYQISLHLATAVNVTMLAGAAIACPITGWAATRYRRHRVILLSSALTAMVLMIFVIYSHPPLWCMFVLMFGIGIAISGYILNFAIADLLSSASSRATFIGFTNGLCMITAPLFQMIIGKLLDISSSGRGALIVGQYTLQDYHFALAFIPMTLLGASVIAMFLKFKRRRLVLEPQTVAT